MKILGQPGSYTKTLLYEELRGIFVYLIISVIDLFIAFMIKTKSHYFVPWGFITILPIIYIFIKIQNSRIQILILLSGINGERKVARYLKKGGYDFIFHGYVGSEKNGDCDHLVVGPYIAVIETKNSSGVVRAIGEGRLSVNGRAMHRKPLSQARKEAQSISKVLGENITPILCITNMLGDPQYLEGVWVCSANHINKIINLKCKKYNHSDIKIFYEKLIKNSTL